MGTVAGGAGTAGVGGDDAVRSTINVLAGIFSSHEDTSLIGQWRTASWRLQGTQGTRRRVLSKQILTPLGCSFFYLISATIPRATMVVIDFLVIPLHLFRPSQYVYLICAFLIHCPWQAIP